MQPSARNLRACVDSPFCPSLRVVVLQLVWFKRDLRVHDHAPLVAAAEAGRVLPVFVHEPEVQQADDFSPRHAAFLRDSLNALHTALGTRGVALLELRGSLPDVFDELCDVLPIAAIHAHEETGNAITYVRDRRVRAWAKRRGVPLHERPGAGVVRRLATRDGWHDRWVATMRRPCAPAPEVLVGATDDELRRVPASLRFARPNGTQTDATTGPRARQRGGREEAESLLHSFLHERGEDYRRAMSSPSEAELACSRISAHLAFGTLSNREAYQAARVRVRELRDSAATVAPSGRASLVRWQQSLVSFASRLEWRDHFTQKLEDEPALEHQPFSPLYADVWPHEVDMSRLDAWRTGHTGFPLVDACMRSLEATGWLTFRMRAMVMSFASHYLWLHWRHAGTVLARAFVDYEPGIHWMQCQMQAGSTGINTIRIYNPVKQAEEHDPDGTFVRRWVPELAALPSGDLYRPWATPAMVQLMHGLRIGGDYPLPLVSPESAHGQARDTLHAVKRQAQHSGESARVWKQHGSRRTPLGRPNR